MIPRRPDVDAAAHNPHTVQGAALARRRIITTKHKQTTAWHMPNRRLQVFRAVATHRSFTKAADALCMTQPAVTFQIRQLEEHFNTRLFDRANGRIALT